MSSKVKAYYTPEEYLALERRAEDKSEYFNGDIHDDWREPQAQSGDGRCPRVSSHSIERSPL